MPDGTTVLTLLELRDGLRIDAGKLSARLRRKIEQLDTMLIMFDRLNLEVQSTNKSRKNLFVLLIATSAVGAIGITLGWMGSSQEYLSRFQAVGSVIAGAGILTVDCYLAMIFRRLQSLWKRRNSQVQDFRERLDATLDKLYQEILAEVIPSQPTLHQN